MELPRDFLARFLQTEDNTAFVCDAKLILREVSPALPLSEGVSLASLFSDPEEYRRAVSDLARGVVFVSTKFELFRHHSTMLLIPILQEDVLQGVFGILETGSSEIRRDPVTMITQVSDRYRTPVTNILNMLSTLSGALQGEEYTRERVYLNAAAKECYAILRGVLPSHDYARLANGTMPFSPQPVLIEDLLEDLHATLRPFFRKRGQTLQLVSAKAATVVSLDTRLFSLALFHLIANAAAFSPLDSTITVSVKVTDTFCTVSVTDEGDGIAAEYLPRVFEPFFTCPDNHLPENEMGAGLGLPTVRAIAKLHGGDVLLASERNKGTTATLRIPLTDTAPDTKYVHADTGKYVADKFSDLYVMFAGLCDIDLFYM